MMALPLVLLKRKLNAKTTARNIDNPYTYSLVISGATGLGIHMYMYRFFLPEAGPITQWTSNRGKYPYCSAELTLKTFFIMHPSITVLSTITSLSHHFSCIELVTI